MERASLLFTARLLLEGADVPGRRPIKAWRAAVVFAAVVAVRAAPVCAAAGTPSVEAFVARLQAGRPTTIACLGDSVTGVYYHSGGRRAYPEMLALALQKLYPNARPQLINAGVSGNTTTDGLARLRSDVLPFEPELVTVMFGLNDMTAMSQEQFRTNLSAIVRACKDAGAIVVLCTPNQIEETTARPTATLLRYVDVIRAVGCQEQARVVDVHAAFEAVRRKDPEQFSLLLSDPIHPNMDGHKLTAATIAEAISGKTASLASEPAPQPALPHVGQLLSTGRPLALLAMPPYDALLPEAIHAVYPQARIESSTWIVQGRSLAEIEADAKRVRDLRPDLVLVAVPWMAEVESNLAFARSYGWVINWSLSFGQQQWDVLVLPPSLDSAPASATERQQDTLVRRLIRAQDLPLIERRPDDERQTVEVLGEWLAKQLASGAVPPP